jgi:flagellar motor switch protein FliG
MKAAILIRSLGSAAAGKILGGLTENEKRVVQGHLEQMGAVSADVIEYVAKEFMDSAVMRAHMARLAPPPKPEETRNRKDGDDAEDDLEGLKAIESLSADEIFELIKDEHPQTIAIILIHLKTPVASDVLSYLSDEIKTDVSVRVATLD